MLAAASGEAAADLRAGRRSAAGSGTAAQSQRAASARTARPAQSRRRSVAYADAPHHEYPQRLDHLVERGLAGCGSEEAQCVGEILLRRGDPASVLLEQVARHGSSVLALGWHGALGAGRALVLKRLLEEAECALLLVRQTDHFRARLNVGKEMDEG